MNNDVVKMFNLRSDYVRRGFETLNDVGASSLAA